MKTLKIKYSKPIIFLFALIISACSQEDPVHYTPADKTESTDPIDSYIKQKLTDPYNCRVVYDWQQFLYIKDFDYAIRPPQRKVIIPIVDMILTYFADPIKKAKNGEAFLKQLFPKEFVFAGSAAYNVSTGHAYAGVAEQGVNIMLTSLDSYDPSLSFIANQVHTIHHEFTHIVNQNTTGGVPTNYKEVHPYYTGVNWVNVKAQDAIKDGFVSAYGSENPNEDFAEMVSTYIELSDAAFNKLYIDHMNYDDEQTKAGKNYIAKKLQIAKDYYKINYKVDLEEIKANVQAELEKS